MAEPDRTGGDAVLSNALKNYPVILGSIPSAKTKNNPRVPGSAVIGSEYIDSLSQVEFPGLIANVAPIENSAAGVGIVNTFPEVDGVNRRMPLIVTVDGKLYPGLSLETLRVAAGDTTFQIKLNPNGVEKMRIPTFGPVSTDNLGRVWIDWSQQSKSVSLTNLPKDFGGAIVIVGPTAAGVSNPLPTSKGAVFPHDVQASVIATMANGVVIERPGDADTYEIIALIVAGIALLFLTRWTYVGLASGIIALAVLYPVSQYLYTHHLWLIDITALACGLVVVLLHAYGVKFVSEFLQKQAIKKQFAGYCSKEVVELLQKDPDLIKRGVRKDVSVMFSDLRGFTPIGEHYGDDVAGLGKYMNGYMDAISQPMLDNKGMVIKYVGDASMHIHGAPIEDPNHARTIVKVGLEMLDKVDEYTKLMEAQGLPPAAMGWGCNSGIGFIGEMGSTERHSYDILGDMVSTAARLEARCKAYAWRNVWREFEFKFFDHIPWAPTLAGVRPSTALTDVRVVATNHGIPNAPVETRYTVNLDLMTVIDPFAASVVSDLAMPRHSGLDFKHISGIAEHHRLRLQNGVGSHLTKVIRFEFRPNWLAFVQISWWYSFDKRKF
jgi:adenylate cyclase